MNKGLCIPSKDLFYGPEGCKFSNETLSELLTERADSDVCAKK